jgi:hypothetical protein
MFWALGCTVGLVAMTGVILALARPITARWEREQKPPVSVDE